MMIKIKSTILVLLCFLAITIKAEVQNMSPQELISAQKKGAVVIDIRTPQEWDSTGTILGAERIMFFDQNRKPQIDAFVKSLDKIVLKNDQPVILVCRSGNRSGIAARFLEQKKGYTKVAHLAKGMNQWLSEKRDVEK